MLPSRTVTKPEIVDPEDVKHMFVMALLNMGICTYVGLRGSPGKAVRGKTSDIMENDSVSIDRRETCDVC